MPKMDTGIRTQQGADLFSRVNHGQTGIHFTKAVFSSVDLTGKSTDDIRQMTDIEPQELVVDQSSTRLQTLDEPVTDQQQNPETVVRAIAVNDPLTADSSGFYVRTFGLYATDDQGNTVLYGVSLDSHPAYMPQFQGQEQRLAFDWDEDTSDKANIQFTNVHTAYVTWWDFQQFSQAIKSGVDSTEATLSNDNASLASSVNSDMSSGSSALSSHSVSMTSFANSMATSLTNSVNGLPHWNDENWTRNQIVPSVANSAANSAGQQALNQANTNMTWNRDSLNGRVNALPNWNDMNWTRGQARNYADSAKSAAQATAATGDYNVSMNATNYTNQKADSAVNVANSNMDVNRRSLQSQINSNDGRHNGEENNLQQQINDAKGNVLNNIDHSSGAIPNGADLNDYTSIGLYNLYGASSLKNSPDGQQGTWGGLLVTHAGGGVFQFMYSTDDNTHLWFRDKTGNPASWSTTWEKTINQDDVASLRGTLQSQITNGDNGLRGQINSSDNHHNDRENYLQTQINNNNDHHNGEESNLQQQINDAKSNVLNNIDHSAGNVPNGADLDEYTSIGFYNMFAPQNVKNSPSGQQGMWGGLLVTNAAYGVFQFMYTTDDNNHIWFRDKTGNPASWSSWFQTQNQYDLQSTATNAMNQAIATANNNMETNRRNLQSEIDNNWNNIMAKQSIFANAKTIENGTDLNGIKGPGFYNLFGTTGLRNTPFGMQGLWGGLIVISAGYGIFEFLYTTGDNERVYFRDCTGNPANWDNWHCNTPHQANNEDDAKNLSVENPGIMFVYPD